MSLKAFHIAFISLSTLLSLGLFLWGVTNNRMLAIVGLLGLVLLVPYFRWFREKMKRLLPCAVCFGDPTSLMSQGARSGVLFLIVLVLVVLTTMAGIAFAWARKSRSGDGGDRTPDL